MAENGNTATFAYTADGDRAKMLLSNNDVTQLTRYYLGGQYEFDQALGATKEKLYLGGDSYSAAAVYVKSNSGSWQVYYIGRDYQGSITHLIDNSGNLVQEISYDPWGRLRNPGTLVAYAPGSEPTLFLDRGYTGHEHLAAFGLINMNARLYDPALGRFLSPDPYVQAPDFSQNFNRYSYCLNNPLRFTDESGEWIHILIGAVVGGTFNLVYKAATGQIHSLKDGLVAFGIGAVAGGLGAATGGLAFAAAGGASGGIGGFLAGAASGAVGSAVSMPIQNLGNHAYFGDPLMSLKEYGIGVGIGAITGGVVNGTTAALNGRNFWDGKLPTPVLDKLTMPSASLLQAQSEVQTPEIESPDITNMNYDIDNVQYTVTTTKDNINTFSTNIEGQTASIERPIIQGRIPQLQSKTDLFHNFPQDFNQQIVNKGSAIYNFGYEDASVTFRAPGTIFSKNVLYNGYYEVGVRLKDNFVIHQFFRVIK